MSVTISEPLAIRRARRRAAVRERIAATRPHETALRTMLVLAHEALREPEAPAPRAAYEPAEALPEVVHDGYAGLVSRVRRAALAHLPRGARVLVVSRGDERLLAGLDAQHFPQGPDGGYAGHYPADGERAIDQVEICHAAGAEFLIFPATAFWWLDYYRDLTQHLLFRRRVVHHDADCLIFDLRQRSEGAPPS